MTTDKKAGRPLTLKQAIAECRRLGYRLTYSSEWEEYRLLPLGPGWHEVHAYYTTDRQDALDTARCGQPDCRLVNGEWV